MSLWMSMLLHSEAMAVDTVQFSICGAEQRINCVVDGDTFWQNGAKIRVADIDAPEIHNARCAEEERRGYDAMYRLQELLNAAPLDLVQGERDKDQYGRKLRVVKFNGKSIGELMVTEGLARLWEGHRMPWCS
ncbi:thermonuclease family protein [Rhizobium rhizogenes]|uniref:thermonuclease family protein n=1 Tax=Rhizobium rhizogenes TaxID=359 RepID=UPI003ED149E1